MLSLRSITWMAPWPPYCGEGVRIPPALLRGKTGPFPWFFSPLWTARVPTRAAAAAGQDRREVEWQPKVAWDPVRGGPRIIQEVECWTNVSVCYGVTDCLRRGATLLLGTFRRMCNQRRLGSLRG